MHLLHRCGKIRLWVLMVPLHPNILRKVADFQTACYHRVLRKVGASRECYDSHMLLGSGAIAAFYHSTIERYDSFILLENVLIDLHAYRVNYSAHYQKQCLHIGRKRLIAIYHILQLRKASPYGVTCDLHFITEGSTSKSPNCALFQLSKVGRGFGSLVV